MSVEEQLKEALSEMSEEDEFRITIVFPPASDLEDGKEEV